MQFSLVALLFAGLAVAMPQLPGGSPKGKPSGGAAGFPKGGAGKK
jgi:hypothetical protein